MAQVRKNREKLLNPELRAIPILLRCMRLSLSAGEVESSSASGPSISEAVLQVMERLLVEAAAKDVCIESYVGFASSRVTMQVKSIQNLQSLHSA
jgi:hypothetical protein